MPSDNHAFVGRIFDLSIIGMHFDSYEDLAKHADCKYAFDTNYTLSMLTRRVESLNIVGRMLWPSNMPRSFKQFPVSRYEWLTASADVFLARYISVVDCAIILVNEVLECGLSIEGCTLTNLKKESVSQLIMEHLGVMVGDQGLLRKERNSRFHHGFERGFSSDDQTFRIGSIFEHRAKGMQGNCGKPLSVQHFFREGLIELQREFNGVMCKVVKQLDVLYDMLAPEFEARFSARFKVGLFGSKGTA